MSPLQPPLRRSRPFACGWRFTLVAASVVTSRLLLPEPLPAQRAPVWVAGGAAALSIGDIQDGKTGAVWRFSTDPMLQLRGSLERTGADGSSIGVVVGHGTADLSLVPFAGKSDLSAEVRPTSCRTGCSATVDVWHLLGQLRTATRATGFHTFFEAQGGVAGFRALRTRATKEAIGPTAMRVDLTGTIGAGFGYALSRDMHLALVQDYGIGWHDRTGIPEGTGRSWRIRTTRASLRFAF
ncbi:MAG: hypothetical protein RLZZ621_1828 [Gemmatimonadota bacterium]